jgi:hypothetical protein
MANDPDKILNPETGKYILKTGKLAKKLIKDGKLVLMMSGLSIGPPVASEASETPAVPAATISDILQANVNNGNFTIMTIDGVPHYVPTGQEWMAIKAP